MRRMSSYGGNRSFLIRNRNATAQSLATQAHNEFKAYQTRKAVSLSAQNMRQHRAMKAQRKRVRRLQSGIFG